MLLTPRQKLKPRPFTFAGYIETLAPTVIPSWSIWPLTQCRYLFLFNKTLTVFKEYSLKTERALLLQFSFSSVTAQTKLTAKLKKLMARKQELTTKQQIPMTKHNELTAKQRKLTVQES